MPTKPRPKTTTEKGLGWKHQRERDILLRRHVDGTPCDWCRRPMYLDRTRNPDYDPNGSGNSGKLQADHSIPRSLGGTKADRLLHGQCNIQRGSGLNDHLAASANLNAAVIDTAAEPLAIAWPW